MTVEDMTVEDMTVEDMTVEDMTVPIYNLLALSGEDKAKTLHY